ncbi:hypothetical protein Dimus_029889 [Dionaea muscipula]
MVTPPDHTSTIWRSRLGSALRIAMACAIIGCTSLYGSAKIRDQIAYPSFAYMVAVLLVSEANLGDTLRGTWEALVATGLVIGPSMLNLWLIGPTRFGHSFSITALAVSISALGVALLNHVPLMSKKIAFGQIVIVYVGAAVQGSQTDIIMHPLHVAASTVTGALASALASLLPLPHLATYEVRKHCAVYAHNAEQRLDIYLKPFLDDESSAATGKSSKSHKTTEATTTKILRSIKKCENGMPWERVLASLLIPSFESPFDGLKKVETTLRGMGMASAAYSRTAHMPIDPLVKDELIRIKETIDLRIKAIKNSQHVMASSTIEPTAEPAANKLKVNSTHQNLPLNFLLFCMKNVNENPTFPGDKRHQIVVEESTVPSSWMRRFPGCLLSLSEESILFALKCSLSLGLSVLLGLSYDKGNGYWSGLAIAIGLVSGRQATLTTVNARAQGTAIGSVYGVLACCIIDKSPALRLASLLPWIIITTFLRHSKAYGEAGSTTAIIGALLILGRKYSGTSSEFAIARLTEAFIGLLCFVMVEILLRPERAANLAQIQLSHSFGALKDFTNGLDLQISQKSGLSSSQWKQKQNKLENEISELKKLIEEAKVEPSLWFKPFQGDWYSTQLESIMRIVDLLNFMVSAAVLLIKGQKEIGATWDADVEEQINTEMELFHLKICSSLECLEEGTKTKSMEEELVKKEKSEVYDLQMGKPTVGKQSKVSSFNEDDDEDIQISFLQQSHIWEKIEAMQNAGLKVKMLLSLSSLGFCMNGVITELKKLQKEVRQFFPREDP